MYNFNQAIEWIFRELSTLLIFIGCGIGGVLRYLTTHFSTHFFGRAFPYGTLAVNAIGAFLMGLLTVLFQSKFHAFETPLRGLLLVGLLGGYTTFSSFSIDTLNLLEAGRYFSVACYVFLSVGLCLAFVWAGALCGKLL